MLKSIDPRLNPDVLHVLALMGHGDVLVLADANFPAASTAAKSGLGRLVRLDNLSLPDAMSAVLSLMPVDDLVSDAACRMQVDDAPEHLPPVQLEALAELQAAESSATAFKGLDRHTFYAQANQAYAVVLTGERRFYGTVLLRKGVIPPKG